MTVEMLLPVDEAAWIANELLRFVGTSKPGFGKTWHVAVNKLWEKARKDESMNFKRFKTHQSFEEAIRHIRRWMERILLLNKNGEERCSAIFLTKLGYSVLTGRAHSGVTTFLQGLYCDYHVNRSDSMCLALMLLEFDPDFCKEQFNCLSYDYKLSGKNNLTDYDWSENINEMIGLPENEKECVTTS